ncbi:TOBE domain-containing protein, partial [Tabrizicola sp.]|uniref:TOBE domain-containing protein n=1 Tax=Tabrizicola sp. TaxID=2005166 RepID=UPI001A47DA4F
LVQAGTPREIYENPVSLYVAGRLGLPRINALPATLFPGAPAGASIIGLRPEHIARGEGQSGTVTRIELKRIHASLGATLLYVTHDQIEAMTMATHVGVLDRGRLVQAGTPREIYENPVSLYVAGRLGLPRINALPAGLFPGAPAGASTIGLRPEHIAQGAGQEGTVTRVEHLGDQTRLHLRLNGHDIVTLTQPHTGLKAGDPIAIAPKNPLWFDASGARIA